MKIFLTGATGFFGSCLARVLLEQTDHELVLLARPGRESSLPQDRRVTAATGDLTDPESLKRGVTACDAVIHAAALVATWLRDRRTFDRVNVEGTLNILRAARDAGASRVIYVSSFLALGHSEGRPLAESDNHERTTHYNDYERTKYLANLKAQEFARSTGLPLVILYPTVMYGPGPLTAGNLVSGMVIEFMKKRLKARPGNGKARWNFVFVQDVVRGVVSALEKAAPGERYILGGENASLALFFETLERVTGVPQPRFSVPWPIVRLTGATEEILAFLTGRVPQTTRGVVNIFSKNWIFDSKAAEKKLGYSSFSLEDGLRRTVDWIRAEGLA